MSRCQECWSSTPARDYENIGEPYKALCTIKESSCPHLHSQNYRSPSTFTAHSDCPACLQASLYSLQFAPGTQFRCCPGVFVPGQNRDITIDCTALVPNDFHHVGGFCHHVDGYNLVAGVSHGTTPTCTCQHSQNSVCCTHAELLAEHGAKFCTDNIVPPKCKVISSLKDYTESPVRECAASNLPSCFYGTPVKYSPFKSANSSSVINTPGKKDKEDEFRLCKQDASLPEDILEWKRKHIEQLQVQQTEVSENNITDELKDIKTSSSAASLLSTPPTTTITPSSASLTSIPSTLLPKDDKNKLKCEAEDSSGSENSTESQIQRIEHLEVELHRQQLKVKLYESMLRKHRQDVKALQLSMQDQKISYEEQIDALQKQLFRLREEQKVNPVIEEQPEPEHVIVETRTVSAASQLQPATSQNLIAISGVAENFSEVLTEQESSKLNGDNMTHEHRLARIQQQISEEEEALRSLRDDLTTKDQHLKTLRMTLRELSSCNCELLEKNLELESMLHRKRTLSCSARVDALENRLLKDIDRCISELNSIAMALVALAGGHDPLPAFLLHGCDDGVGRSNAVTGNSADTAKARLYRVSELQAQIGELRELVMQRILSNHYTVKSSHPWKSTL